MIAASLLACLSTIQAARAPSTPAAATMPPILYVEGAGGLEPLRALDDGSTRALVPLLSRSERRPRAVQTARGIGFAIFSAERGALDRTCDEIDRVEVRAIAHPSDSQLLFAGPERSIVLVGPPVLPVVAQDEAGADVLPVLARQDANCVAGSVVRVDPPKGEEYARRIEIAGEGGFWSAARDGIDHATITPLDPAHPIEVDTRVTPLDQIFFARGRDLPEDEGMPLRLRACRLRVARIEGWSPVRAEGDSLPDIALGDEVTIPVRPSDPQPTDLAARLASRDDPPLSLPGNSLLEVWFDPPGDPPEGATWTLVISVRARENRFLCGESEAPSRFVPPASGRRDETLFRDVAREAGISMVHFEGPDLQLDIRPTMGPGAAWGDVDGDGWVDLFLPQGGGREGSRKPTSRFFRNRADGTFADESKARGLALEGAGMGALFFDADGDSDLDLFVASYGANRFLENDGAGRFTDRSADVGLAGEAWNTAASAADYDQDGDLDLYVTRYLEYDVSKLPPAEELDRYQREDPIEMLPFAFPGARKLFLRNDSRPGATSPALRFAFTDVAKELGVDDPAGRGMQAVFWDFDRDGDQDLLLANDVSPNRMWRNEGDGRFKDVSLGTGLDDPRGCMGLSAADVDGDGDEDVLITNWQLEANALYTNNLVNTSARSRVAAFRDTAVQAGLAQLKVGVTAWGAELADFDLDQDLDLFYANGYTSPDYESTGVCVGQPCHYFENDGRGRFVPAFERAGPDVALPLASRAAQACDYDQDGDLDLVVTANNGRVRLLRNELAHGGLHWLGVRLRAHDGNPFAIGAEVEVHVGESVLRRSMRAGTSYLGGNAPELHFGLGSASKVDRLIVRWPSGRESRHAIERCDAFVTVAEPDVTDEPR